MITQRFAEVERNDAFEPARVLNVQGLIETVQLASLFQLFGDIAGDSIIGFDSQFGGVAWRQVNDSE